MHLDGKSWTFTRKFAAKKGQSRFLKRLDEVRGHFPELDGQTVKLGITLNVPGKADLENKGVFFRSRNVSNYVIGHEFTHLLQGIGKVPKGERSCDIFTMARNVEFCDQAPNYLKIPKRLLDEKEFIRKELRGMVHETAKAAVMMRESGKRKYISWFENSLEEVCGNKCEDQSRTFDPLKMKPTKLVQARLEDFIG